MSLSAAVIRELVAAGLSGDELVEACERIETAEFAAAEPQRRSSAAIRQARYRERKASQGITRDVTGITRDAPSAPAGFSPEPPFPNPSIHTPPSAPKGASPPVTLTPRSELEVVLDADHAQAVIEHRQRIRKPLTAHAAKLLAGKFSRATDPNAAADAMIANGWQGFEPEWLDSRARRQQRGPPQPPWKPRNAGEWALQNLGMIDEDGNSTGKLDRRDDAGDADGFEAGDGAPVLLAFSGRGGS